VEDGAGVTAVVPRDAVTGGGSADCAGPAGTVGFPSTPVPSSLLVTLRSVE
jgi:hypothetical protein